MIRSMMPHRATDSRTVADFPRSGGSPAWSPGGWRCVPAESRAHLPRLGIAAPGPARGSRFPPIFDRRIEVDFVARMDLGGGYEGGVRWKFGSALPFTRPLGSYVYYGLSHGRYDGRLTWGSEQDEGFAVHLGDRNGSRYPPYHRLDVSVRKDFRRDWGSITPYVSVVNLYDRRNVLFYFYNLQDDPPTRGGVSMFPVLPSVGLEVHF